MNTPNHFPESDFEPLRDAYVRVWLPDVDKTRLRAELSAYADLHELMPSPIASPYATFSFFARARVMYAGAFAILIFATGTGLAAAAQKALPGDALYAMKVQVTEPVQVALIPTLTGKAQFHSVLAERRLEEAQQLIQKNALTPEAEATLASNFAVQVASADQTAAAVEAKGDAATAVAIHSDLEARIEAQQTLLSLALDEGTPTPHENVTTPEPSPSEGHALLLTLAQTRQELRASKLALLERSGGVSAAESGAQVALAQSAAETLDAQGAATVPAVAARIENARNAARAATEALGVNDQTGAGEASADAVRNVEVASILMTHKGLLAKLSASAAASTTIATTTATTTLTASTTETVESK